MSIRRRCTEWSCPDGRKCLEHLRFDVMWRGKRYRMAVNDFAIPRMESGKQRPIQSMEEARDWERLFIGEIKAGRDTSADAVFASRDPDRRRRDVPRGVLGAVRQTGGAAQFGNGAKPDHHPEAAPR
jgi:hypothetical protein